MTSVSNGGTTTLGLYDTQSQLKEKADITYVDNKVDPLVGGHKGFSTLALAQAAQSGLAANTVVEVLSDTTEVNNGYYLWNGTTLTKSVYDPLAQAKQADLQPYSTKEGVFLFKPYYELDRKTTKLYVKLNVDAGTDNTFFIRDSRYTSVTKTLANIESGITASAHPKLTVNQTSPLGVPDCLCFDTKVALYYDTSTQSFFAADRPTNGTTYLNAIKIIELDGGEITECQEKAVILDQIALQDRILNDGKNKLTNCYCDTRFSKSSVANTNYGININTDTGMIEVPDQFTVLYSDPMSKRFDNSAAYYQAGHTEFQLSAELATYLVLNLKTKLLAVVARSALASYADPYLIVMIVRHSTNKAVIYSVSFSSAYSINDSLYGVEIYTNKINILLPNQPSSGSFLQSKFYPDISYDGLILTIFADSILRCGNKFKVLATDTVIDLSAVASTAKAVYYDFKKDTFHVVAYNYAATTYQKTTWVLLGIIRIATNYRNVSFDNGIPYTVDGLLYSIPKACDTVRNQINGLYGVAHRGANQTAPENTKAAYELAKTLGFRAVETDIQKTSDGVFICHHDSTLTKVTGGLLNDKVSDHTWDELKDLDIGSWKDSAYASERFLTLKDFCELCYKLNLYAVMELSPTRTFTVAELKEIRKIVMDSGVSHVYISFFYQTLINLVLVDKAANFQFVSETLDTTTIQRIKNLRTQFNDPQMSVNHLNIASKQQVDDLKKNHGIRLNCWTVNDESRALELADWGVQSISSDFINVESLVLG